LDETHLTSIKRLIIFGNAYRTLEAAHTKMAKRTQGFGMIDSIFSNEEKWKLEYTNSTPSEKIHGNINISAKNKTCQSTSVDTNQLHGLLQKVTDRLDNLQQRQTPHSSHISPVSSEEDEPDDPAETTYGFLRRDSTLKKVWD
jgi:hypothetical protein